MSCANNELAKLLGFQLVGLGQYDLPSESAFSRFHVKLKEEQYLKDVRAIFERTVVAIDRHYPELGKHSALDASDVRSHARPPRYDSSTQTEGKQSNAGEKRCGGSDPEASWSIKKHGKKSKSIKKTFGYKLYAVADSSLPAVLAVEVKTGSTADHHMAISMLEATQSILGASRLKTMAMDKGFDSEPMSARRGRETLRPLSRAGRCRIISRLSLAKIAKSLWLKAPTSSTTATVARSPAIVPAAAGV